VVTRPPSESLAHSTSTSTWISTYWFTASAYGHIAYVAAVYTNGTVLLQDYNGFGGDRVYGTKQLPADGVPRYLHYAG